MPIIAGNPDDGLLLGLADTYTVMGFDRNPFTAKHTLGGAYYFATNGYDLDYKGEFANIIGSWNLGFDVSFTSPNYSVNFFGFGNETIDPNAEDEDTFDRDYNRVKLQTFKISPSLIWQGDIGSKVRIGLNYETIEVEETQDRFINTFFDLTEEDNQNSFASLEAQYSFINKNDRAYPTLGFEFDLLGGLTANFDKETSFAYVIPSMAFDHRLSANDQLVLATKLRGHLIFGDDFEFYQAANIGAENGLRGYRFQRFTGKNSFVHSTDLRLNMTRFVRQVDQIRLTSTDGLGRLDRLGNTEMRWVRPPPEGTEHQDIEIPQLVHRLRGHAFDIRNVGDSPETVAIDGRVAVLECERQNRLARRF